TEPRHGQHASDEPSGEYRGDPQPPWTGGKAQCERQSSEQKHPSGDRPRRLLVDWVRKTQPAPRRLPAVDHTPGHRGSLCCGLAEFISHRMPTTSPWTLSIDIVEYRSWQS